MGCASSKIETEVAVKRCKARKHYMKQTVTHRHAFAAANALYAKSLKSTGAAIRQFADVEVPKEVASTGTSSASHHQVLHTVPNLFPPPQPPEDPFSGRRAPLPRAASMPPIPIMTASSKGSLATHPQALSEDEEEDSDEDPGYSQHKPTHSEPYFVLFDNISIPGASTFDTEDFEPKSSGMETRSDLDYDVEQEQSKTQMPASQVKAGLEDTSGIDREVRKQTKMPVYRRSGKSDKDFGTILRLLDDFFLESYEAGREVCQMLEAQRDYHHIPFVDERSGIKEHNKKVSHILTWTRSSSGSLLASEEIDVLSSDSINLASTLDRLHAWEKKLYDEVKAAEATRLELDRRSAQLKSQKERGEGATSIERTKARVKSLQTRYLVEFEAVDAAISEVKKLRDDCLYRQLMDLLEALKKMWAIMFSCHQKQVPLVEELRDVEATPTIKETSDFCKKITDDLEREIESDAVDNAAASQKVDIPLYDLCQAWADVLKHLSADNVLQSLRRFSGILHEMVTKQADEIKQKRRKEELHKELEKKKKAFEAFESKYKDKASIKEVTQGLQESSRHPIQERRALIDLLEKNVAEEEQRHAKLCEENSTMIFQSLKDGLPDVILNIMAFSQTCAKEYGSLYDLANPA
ncbi:hypothetical protein GOP47_0028913 [Adiantum capillus-veneris]|nr:hypothetical protein GOP47_0028913 [Adiantum capillus-veneris]